jgi:ABC-type transporter Mla MlaB component
MLRITTHEKGDLVVLKLEGRLTGPWVAILRDCWQSRLAHPGQMVQVDLRGVTFVGAAGRALLAEMSRQNAKFSAGGCEMKAILAEIVRPGAESL